MVSRLIKNHHLSHKRRLIIVSFLLVFGLLGLVFRIFQLAIFHRSFLIKQSNARILRTTIIPAYRGKIFDKNGNVLAVSTPVSSLWINPSLFKPSSHQWHQLAYYLGESVLHLKKRVTKYQHKGFVYLKRDMTPTRVKKIKSLKIGGLFFQQEFRRYYPRGAMTAHVVGITNIDDHGQEGLELAYDKWLRGKPGKQEVIKDRFGHVIKKLALLKAPQSGHDLQLTIDPNIQYIVYRELKLGFKKSHAKAATAIVLDAWHGDILAMVNFPTYNPNHHPRPSAKDGRYRNRAVTDLFESGSTMKTFSIAHALASGRFSAETRIDTNPGWLIINGNKITDESINHGVISVEEILKKSSNIGTAKIALSLPAKGLVHFLKDLGFSQRTESFFPGEASGRFLKQGVWDPFSLATLSFGYGISVTALQLAEAYSILATGGIKRAFHLVKGSESLAKEKRVLSKKVTNSMLHMLNRVTHKGGTGYLARVPGYEVAGKTGTSYRTGVHGYDKSRYIASFIGVAPLKNPRFVVAVIVWEPEVKRHYGGLVAAPIFSNIMAEILGVQHIGG